MEPPADGATAHRQVGKSMSLQAGNGNSAAAISSAHLGAMQALRRTGQFCGGLWADVKRKSRFYLSDFTDAFRATNFTQILAATLFLYIADLTNVITFGGVMGKLLHKEMGAIENLVSSAVCGVVYALFSGQPLTIMSATGPVLVFELILYRFCM